MFFQKHPYVVYNQICLNLLMATLITSKIYIYTHTIETTLLHNFHNLVQVYDFGYYVHKSISNGVQCVILHSKIGWRKMKICLFGSRKCFGLS